MQRKLIAAQTLEILERGYYESPHGRVTLNDQLQACVEGTQCYLPDELTSLQDRVLSQPPPYAETTFEVVNETTLQGCFRLTSAGNEQKIGVLNFASAKNPGGGFLSGAQAQEESLARSSGLYPSLLKCRDHYDFHRVQKTSLYSDHMIYSPQCPVIKDDEGNLLDRTYLVDFVTSPAPNAGAIQQNEPKHFAQIPDVLRVRSAKVLALAAQHGCETLVLGAWGCGVFRNDPQLVAEVFSEHLKGVFAGRFQHVLFSVLDTRGGTIFKAFAERFG